MQWVNLAKQLPDFPLHKTLLRVVGTNSNILTVLANWYKLTDKTLTLTDRDVGAVWELDELEWLDETVPNIPEGYFLAKSGSTIVPKGKEEEWARKFLAADIDKIRREQHETTLFNAMDVIEPHWALTDPYLTVRGQIKEKLATVQMEKIN